MGPASIAQAETRQAPPLHTAPGAQVGKVPVVPEVLPEVLAEVVPVLPTGVLELLQPAQPIRTPTICKNG